mgnify:CR=1 FL=1
MYSQDELKESILSGFYEYNPDSSENFKSSLVLNDTKTGKKSLEFILENLENCNSFRFSVAFITSTGFTNANYELWPFFSQHLLFILMFLGAMGGSTSGGMKIARILLLIKVSA